MNDSNIVAWIAGHLRTFRISISGAEMQFIDDSGAIQTIRLTTEVNMTEEELLRECINNAIIASTKTG